MSFIVPSEETRGHRPRLMSADNTLIGIDVGSSSIKAALFDPRSQRVIAKAASPDTELDILAPHPGFAEQAPEVWWTHVRAALARLRAQAPGEFKRASAIGIAYQMHGLVMLDHSNAPVGNAIIWCDGRGAAIGDEAFQHLGRERCLSHLYNSPGNFTLTRLAWVRRNQPDLFRRIKKICLPGDYIALRLTGELATTRPGLSEQIAWDFAERRIALFLLGYLDIPESVLPPLVPVFGHQGMITREAASDLGIEGPCEVTYRAGDQPNNALSLNVLRPGEVAATAGTSGVVYGVMESGTPDPDSRFNIFLHVTEQPGHPVLGALLCINGAGSAYRWVRQLLGLESYSELNRLAEDASIGASGLHFLPYGNGAERTLKNRDPGMSLHGVDLNRHSRPHLARACIEGVAAAMWFGMNSMISAGLNVRLVRAGNANMFLSPVFRSALAALSKGAVELFDTDGATGAARAAGVGAGMYSDPVEALSELKPLSRTEAHADSIDAYAAFFEKWATHL